MSAPTPTGERLGLLYGHSLPEGAWSDRGPRRDVETSRGPVQVVDAEDLVLLCRHGLDDFVPAHRIDHQRHIEALAVAGCDRVVALASVGSLRADWGVGTQVAPDDFFALDVAPTFHAGVGGHGIPGFDVAWRRRVVESWDGSIDRPLADGGVYAHTDGPRFETPAEVRFLAGHADVVGMTLVPEIVLSREAGIAYAAVCTVDNLANGLGDQDLTMEMFREAKARNDRRLLADLDRLVPALLGP